MRRRLFSRESLGCAFPRAWRSLTSLPSWDQRRSECRSKRGFELDESHLNVVRENIINLALLKKENRRQEGGIWVCPVKSVVSGSQASSYSWRVRSRRAGTLDILE